MRRVEMKQTKRTSTRRLTRRATTSTRRLTRRAALGALGGSRDDDDDDADRAPCGEGWVRAEGNTYLRNAHGQVYDASKQQVLFLFKFTQMIHSSPHVCVMNR
jgi:hypothetical protein